MKTHKEMVTDKAWQSCKAGHKSHDTVTVPTELGDMQIYDFGKYMGFDGYCSGQDDVSRTLKLYGVWEPAESAEIRAVLEAGDRQKLFIDVGAHVGWYSRMAEQLGYKVHAYEADEENCQLLEVNAPGTLIYHTWIDADTEQLPVISNIELLKIDIEGNEQHAIKMFGRSLLHGKIDNIYMEVSPVFNDSYPALVKRIEDYGFMAYENGKPFNHDYNFPQTNLLFKRVKT